MPPRCWSLDHDTGCAAENYVAEIAEERPKLNESQSLRNIIPCATSYRQSEIYAREGVDLARSTMVDWVGKAGILLSPLIAALRNRVLTGERIHGDDTPVPVLEPGRGKTKTGRLWVYVRDGRPHADETPPAVCYFYSPDRKAIHPRTHGGQQLRLFNGHYDKYGFQPIVVFDGDGRFVTAMLRPAKRPKGKEIARFLRRLLRAIRVNWPGTKILIRADSHYCCPEVIDFCRVNGLDFILGVAPTTTLRRHVEALEQSTRARFEAGTKNAKLRRFKEFYYSAASWSRSSASLPALKPARPERTRASS